MKYINGVIGAPDAIGPYSQAVIVDNLVFISGQVPLNPDTGKLVEGGIGAQAAQVMKNLFAILAHMGLDFSHVVKSTIFLTDLDDFHTVNEVYAQWLGELRPARATLQVAALPLKAEIEIEMIARLEAQDSLMTYHGSDSDLDSLSESGYSVSPGQASEDN